MRRLVATALASAGLVTGLTVTASPAVADTEAQARVSSSTPTLEVQPGVSAKAKRKYFKVTGLAATSTWGNYYWSSYKGYRTRVLDVTVQDNKKGKYSCVNVIFAPKKSQGKMTPENKVIWNPHGKGTKARKVIQSYRVGYLYMRECEGYNTKKGFKITAAGKWYRWAW